MPRDGVFFENEGRALQRRADMGDPQPDDSRRRAVHAGHGDERSGHSVGFGRLRVSAEGGPAHGDSYHDRQISRALCQVPLLTLDRYVTGLKSEFRRECKNDVSEIRPNQ